MAEGKSDCEALLAAVLPQAKRMLGEFGEFYPYGGALGVDGEVFNLSGYDGRDHPPSADILLQIKKGLIDGVQAGTYKATAVVFDVRVTLTSGVKSDAIAVSLEHRDRYSVLVALPYAREEGALQYGTLIAQPREAEIFGPQ